MSDFTAQMQLTFKHGDSVVFAGELTHNNGSNFTGWAGASAIHKYPDNGVRGELVAPFVFEWLDVTQGEYKLTLADSSPLTGMFYVFDIQLTTPEGLIQSLPTVRLNGELDVT